MDVQPTANPPEDAQIAVHLTPYEWHVLLRELEHFLRVVNRDRTNLTKTYEAIASQLAGSTVKVAFEPPVLPKEPPVQLESDRLRPWWKRLTGRPTAQDSTLQVP